MSAPAAVELLLPRRFSRATQAGPLREGRVLRLQGETMGTHWIVQAVVRDTGVADALRDGTEALLARLVGELSHWQPDSALCVWNAAPAGSLVPLPAQLRAVVDAALAIARASGGALDPTLGALVDLWGFGPPGPRVDGRLPGAAELAAARARCGWQRLQRSGDALRQPGGLQLDLSGIAKGHAVDRIADWLAARGLVHHCVEIGGELRAQGVKPDGQPWWVAIDDGAVDGPRIALDGMAIATSGDAWRRAVLGGRLVSHTLNPWRGEPLADPPAAVSVLHGRAREADGWATALSVLGPVAGLACADANGLAARWRQAGANGCATIVRSAAWRALTDEGG